MSAIRDADLLLLNLECCISTRRAPWPDSRKPFFFRAPPVAAETLARLGVDCVTLANNHALDYGSAAVVDTLEHLDRVGIAWVGAGRTESEAQQPTLLTAAGLRLAVIGVTDHPAAYAAGTDRPGAALLDAGATLIAGHSAHLFRGVEPPILYDLGDFVDDYRTDPWLRNDLGLLFMVSLDRRAPRSLEALPLKLDYCRTRLATGEDAAWVRRRFLAACRELGTDVAERDGRLLVGFTGGTA